MRAAFGPNIPGAHGSHISCIELLNRYFVRTIHKMQMEGIKTFCVKEQVSREYNQHIGSLFSKLVFSDNCRSWYKRGDKNNPVTMYPHTRPC